MNNMNILSYYRSALMGIATIMVLLFHFQANFGTAPINAFSSIGYGGVDIFLFLSGFGLINGYKGNTRQFYIRRLARLYPTYLLCAFLTFWQKGDINPLHPLIASTGIGYFLPGMNIPSIEWYVPTMYVLYLIFPWFMKKSGIENIQKTVAIAITFGLFLTAILIFIQKGTVILTTSRIPIFFIGVYFGFLYKCNISLSGSIMKFWMSLSVVALCIQMYIVSIFDVVFLWRNAIYFLPFSIIVPGLSFLISKVLDKFNKNISFCFSFVGSLSLEMYLIHVLLLNYWKRYLFDWTISYTTMSFIFFFILVLLCSYLLSFIINPLSKYIKKYAQ